jgi:hypothetical protein
LLTFDLVVRRSGRLSGKNFLVMPVEEVNALLGGHWYLMTPKPVYFSHGDAPDG